MRLSGLSADDIWSSLAKLGLLQDHLARLSSNIFSALVQPYFEALSSSSPSSFHPSSEGGCSGMQLASMPEQALLASLQTLLSFFAEKLPRVFDLLSQPVPQRLTAYVDGAIPSTTHGLGPFRALLSTAEALETTFFPDSKHVRSVRSQLSTKWVEKVNGQTAQACRSLVSRRGAQGWDSISVDYEPLQKYCPIASSSALQDETPIPEPLGGDPPPPSSSEAPAEVPKSAPASKGRHNRNFSTAVIADNDEWGFDDPPAPPPSKPAPALKSKGRHDRNFSTAVVADNNGWGFGEDDVEDHEPTSRPEPAEATAPDNNGEDDGWGFDDDDEDDAAANAAEDEEAAPLNVAAAKPATKLMKGKHVEIQPAPVQPASHLSGYDAWGFDEDEDETERPQEYRQADPVLHQTQGSGSANESGAAARLRYTISKHSQELVQLSESVLVLMSEVKKPLCVFSLSEGFPGAWTKSMHSFDMASEQETIISQLMQTFFDVFDYFLATLPLCQRQVISSVPALGMQFANDCEWLSTQVITTLHGKEDIARHSDRINSCAQRLTRCAAMERRKQVVRCPSTLELDDGSLA